MNKLKKDYTVYLHTIKVGALGTVDKKHTLALKLMDVPDKLVD